MHIDTSAGGASRHPAEYVTFKPGHGRFKVFFGIHVAMMLPGECLDGLDALNLPDEAKTLCLADNARRVFKLG